MICRAYVNSTVQKSPSHSNAELYRVQEIEIYGLISVDELILFPQ